MLSGLADDLAAGPDAVDREQLDLAVELLRDVGDYAEDNTVEKALDTISRWASSSATSRPRLGQQARAPVRQGGRAWEELEWFVESRLRRE